MDGVTHHGRRTVYRRFDRSGGDDGDGEDTGDRDGNGGSEPGAMLCIHGSGGSSGVWKAQSRLADRRPVVALDLSGHGESEDVDADPGYGCLSAYADDVVAVARETDARVLVGNSLGGAVAMTVALERGGDLDLDGLVLAGTGARLAVLDDLLHWLEGDFERAVEFLHAPDRLFHDPDERYLSESREAMLEAGQAVTSRDFHTCHVFDVRDRLGDVDVPALAVVGEHDQLTPPYYHEFLAEEMPDCDLAVVEDAAHLAMVEQPEAFNAALEEFFERL
ncbi:alpha/beta fold hydrolase [Halobium salinum]|uniref:Alpha/beta fold hydrolase n=1 Tax=Halobium salinum TaxID=1364940 RepID=A0ABD5P9E5_9EURY|nr:alpha/beta hydrolase [Halobium salinum]